MNRTLKFNAVAGMNRIMCEVQGGCWSDGHGTIKTYSRTTDEDGDRVQSRPIEIPWKDRLLQSNIDKVAPFRKYVVDLEKPYRRQRLQDIVDGKGTDELMELAGVSSIEEAQKELELSISKRHEFISEWDFVAFAHKIVSSEKTKNLKFVVSGQFVISEYDNKFYQHYKVQRITRAADDAEYSLFADINVNFGQGAVDDGSVEDKGKYYIKGYTFDYDPQRKMKIPCPVTLALPVGNDAKSQAYANIIKKNFTINVATDGDICKELTVKVECIDGAERLELTEDMLSDNEKELLMIGATTMDELVRDRGQQIYGDRVRELVITGFARGWLSGARLTAYSKEDFVVPPLNSADTTAMADDLFADDDDIDI